MSEPQGDTPLASRSGTSNPFGKCTDSPIKQSRLKDILEYIPDEGIFIWKERIAARSVVGSVAGSVNLEGYIKIQIQGKRYAAHRLAWMYVHGEFPVKEIDHMDHNKSNNRIANLRPVSTSENQQNRNKARIDNKSSGLLGVGFCKSSGKYTAHIRVNGKQIHLGCFENPEIAHAAYLEKKKFFHPSSILQGKRA